LVFIGVDNNIGKLTCVYVQGGSAIDCVMCRTNCLSISVPLKYVVQIYYQITVVSMLV